MTSFQAGAAYSSYDLRIDGVRQSVAEAKRLIRELQASAQSLNKTTVGLGGGDAGKGLRQSQQAAQQAVRQFQQLEKEFDRTRDSEIRLARASGDHAKALQLIDQALQRTSAGTVRYNNLLAQQATVERQAAQRRPGGGGGALGQGVSGLQGAAGALGIGVGIREVYDLGKAAVTSALDLRRAEVTMRALSGTTAQYNQVVAQARQNQELFGGTLAENISQLGGLEIISRRTGASIGQLNDISKRLGVLSPEQGTSGAIIALNEALTGNITSLERRFEIPRKELAKLKDESISTSEKLQILSDYLDKAGVSSEAVGKNVSEEEKIFNRYTAAVDRASAAFGRYLLQRGAGKVAQFGAGVGNAVSLAFDQAAIAEQANQRVAESTTTYDAYVAKLREVNAQIPFYVEGLRQMSEGEFRAAQARTLAAQGLEGYKGALSGVRDVFTEQIEAQKKEAAELQKTAGANVLAAEKSAELKDAQDRLSQQAQATARALLRTGTTGAAQAALLAASSNDIDIATAAYYRLFAAQQATQRARQTTAQDLADRKAAEAAGDIGVQPGDRAAAAAAARAGVEKQNAARLAKERQAEIDAARRRQLEATGTTAQRLAAARKDLAALTPGTSEYVDAQTKVIQLQQQLNAEIQRGAAARERAAKADDRAVLKERTDELKEQKSAEEALRSAIDARLAAVDDAEKRLDEAKEADKARRVLATAGTSQDARARARLVLERIPLEQLKRAEEIARQTREAGGVVLPAGARGIPGAPAVALPQGPVGRAAAAQAAALGGAQPVVVNADIRVLLDGKEIAAAIESDVSGNLVLNLRSGLAQAASAGAGRTGP